MAIDRDCIAVLFVEVEKTNTKKILMKEIEKMNQMETGAIMLVGTEKMK
jgi:hypothetical protein